MNGILPLLISNIHVFLRAIYNIDGTITNNASTILLAISTARLVSTNGTNFGHTMGCYRLTLRGDSIFGDSVVAQLMP
jgi:hypothetical protein